MLGIRLPHDSTLDPAALAIASLAYDKACRDLGLTDDTNLIAQVIAAKIVEVTLSGKRDVQGIWEQTLLELGVTTLT